MSEYQYYEFQAIDRPLTASEMRELRSCSSRATITSSRFVNHYEWGEFKGDSSVWMEKYFDAFLYLANWGSHELTLRLPRKVFDPATAKRYCRGGAASSRSKGDFVILDFESQEGDLRLAGPWSSRWSSGRIRGPRSSTCRGACSEADPHRAVEEGRSEDVKDLVAAGYFEPAFRSHDHLPGGTSLLPSSPLVTRDLLTFWFRLHSLAGEAFGFSRGRTALQGLRSALSRGFSTWNAPE